MKGMLAIFVIVIVSCQSPYRRWSWSRETDFNVYIEEPTSYCEILTIRHFSEVIKKMNKAREQSGYSSKAIAENRVQIEKDRVVSTIFVCGRKVYEENYAYADGVLQQIEKTGAGLRITAEYSFSGKTVKEEKRYFSEDGSLAYWIVSTTESDDMQDKGEVRYESPEFARIDKQWLSNYRDLFQCRQ